MERLNDKKERHEKYTKIMKIIKEKQQVKSKRLEELAKEKEALEL